MIRFEVVITAWKDGLHRGREVFNFDYYGDDTELITFENAIGKILNKIQEDKDKWQKIAEDDDIPF